MDEPAQSWRLRAKPVQAVYTTVSPNGAGTASPRRAPAGPVLRLEILSSKNLMHSSPRNASRCSCVSCAG